MPRSLLFGEETVLDGHRFDLGICNLRSSSSPASRHICCKGRLIFQTSNASLSWIYLNKTSNMLKYTGGFYVVSSISRQWHDRIAMKLFFFSVWNRQYRVLIIVDIPRNLTQGDSLLRPRVTQIDLGEASKMQMATSGPGELQWPSMT